MDLDHDAAKYRRCNNLVPLRLLFWLLGTNVTDAGLEHLEGPRNLKHLVLNETRVTDAGVGKLQQVLPNCKIAR